ncbi:hypothetical protein [Pseudonocardia sp. NPDC046786]|uniref:hypothetical protein n=1 Tax=Pseudonocardia sp. NPDC046786 TaxID=3155471 RepID=UPI0033E3649A
MAIHRDINKAITAVTAAGITLPAELDHAYAKTKMPVTVDNGTRITEAEAAVVAASTEDELTTAVAGLRDALSLNSATPDDVRSRTRVALENHLAEVFQPLARDLLSAVADRFDQEAAPLVDAITRIPADLDTLPVTSLTPAQAQAIQDATAAYGRVAPAYDAFGALYLTMTGSQLGNPKTVAGASRRLAAVSAFEDPERFRDAVEWLIQKASNPVHVYGPVAAAVLFGGQVSLARSTAEVEARRHEVVEAGPPMYVR